MGPDTFANNPCIDADTDFPGEGLARSRQIGNVRCKRVLSTIRSFARDRAGSVGPGRARAEKIKLASLQARLSRADSRLMCA